MPKTRFQRFAFGAMMSIIMAVGIEFYNVARKMGGMSNGVFLPALIEASYMCLFVYAISTICGNRVGKSIALRLVTPGKDNSFFVLLMISSCTVMFMCPVMSLIATTIFMGINNHCGKLAFNCRKEFSDGILLAAFLCGARGAISIQGVFQISTE